MILEMDIVLCVDKNYLFPAMVTVASICRHNTDVRTTFHVITDSSSVEDLKLLDTVACRYNSSCCYYVVPDSICEKMPLTKGNHPIYFSKATYYRLFLSSILPESIEKVLYLDSDLICVDSLKELWSLDVADKAVFAVSDMYEGDVSFYNRLQYYPQEGYFNGGVELINLKYWRDNSVEETFVDYAVSHADAIFHHDQDIMNYTLKEVKGSLPLRYNVQDGFLYCDIHLLSWYRQGELDEARTSPAIIHYTGRFKPWCEECNHPWKDVYMKIAADLGFSEKQFPVIKDTYNLYKSIRSLCVRLHIIPPTLLFDPEVQPLSE